jgi:hypothetical protein
MSRQQRPEIGTILWDVHENLYYVPGRAGPLLEYIVTSAPVTDYFEGGYVEIKMVGEVPGHGMMPRHHKLSDLGKRKVFQTPREAALYAKELTEKYEKTWGWTSDPPLRRTWEKFLEENL